MMSSSGSNINNTGNTRRKNQANVIQLMLFRYWPYWPLFLALCGIMVGVAWCYLRIAKPVYQITATILIKDEKKGVEDPRMVESLNIYTSKKIVENEIEVIKSKTLMQATADALHLSVPVFEEGFLSHRSAFTSSPILVELQDFVGEAEKISFNYVSDSSKVLVNGLQFQLGQWYRMAYGEIRFVKNPYCKTEGKGPFFFSVIDPRKVTNSLVRNLLVQASNKLSTVVNLILKDEVPQRGELILNKLIESYNDAGIDAKNSLAANTLKFVEDRITAIERDLQSVEQDIENYKSKRGIVDLSEQGKLYLENVGDNDQKLSELSMQLAVLNKLEDYVIRKNNASGIVPSTLGITDTRLSGLIQKLYDSEIQYEKLRKTTAENNPILISLQAEIENLRPGVLENVRNQRQSLNTSISNLTSTNNKYASILETIPQKERELLEANRQQAIKNNVYTFLLQKREETALSYASAVSDSRLVDRAQASLRPVSPNTLLTYGSAVGFALFLGIAWVTKKEIFSNAVLFRSEIETLTQIPILAEISHSTIKDYVVIENKKVPFLTEQFRQLRAAAGLYGESPKKVIMITSAIGGEGKSFISANFATSLASSKRRVLMLDLDIRNPRLTHHFNGSKAAGITEYINGDISLEEIIGRTSTKNLFLIGAGKNRTNPTETLLSANFHQLFERLRQMFDYIIVDTAPVEPVIDAYIISPQCDATLFVVRHGRTPKTILQMLDDNIKVKALNNISIVFNGVRSRGLVKGAYGYGYGYGYEYIYADLQLGSKGKSKT
jgi:capsular exopolysaccharide synthesis family protein